MDEKELEMVTGGSSGNDLMDFFGSFSAKNCAVCQHTTSTCPYGGKAKAKYEAFNGNKNATCPERKFRNNLPGKII